MNADGTRAPAAIHVAQSAGSSARSDNTLATTAKRSLSDVESKYGNE
jgi:hypothetical protein